jgi:hypothetical protein
MNNEPLEREPIDRMRARLEALKPGLVTRALPPEFTRPERVGENMRNILPAEIATRLRNGESNIADHFDDATVIFADVVELDSAS